MKICVDVRKNSYYDSVALMLVSKELKKLPGIAKVIVGMGTGLNKELASNLGLCVEEVLCLTPNDLFIAASVEDNVTAGEITGKADELLNSKRKETDTELEARTLGSALKLLPGANMVVISVPGRYAAYEAEKALQNGLHVMLFSDNVAVDEEIRLKNLGRDKGLLVMGPDCGTAIINHVPLCFANAVRKGDIGIVGASGTGTQEVSVIIDKLGGGISQVIGTGGRDLTEQVGGIMMLEGFKALIDDPDTGVTVLISKPPAAGVEERILAMADKAGKPVVVYFIGGDRARIERHGAYACVSLEDAARKAVSLSIRRQGKLTDIISDFTGFDLSDGEIDAILESEASRFKAGQKYLRALYTGGTLADEAMRLLKDDGFRIFSNTPLSPELKLENSRISREHTCIDLGDDEFTVGKPHPMIDPSGRAERLALEAEDETAAMILMDFVLGFGSNADPAGEMLPAILEAKASVEERGGYLSVIGYVCGTERDIQNIKAQKEKLEQAGVIVMPSNAQAARFVSKLLGMLQKGNSPSEWENAYLKMENSSLEI